MVAAMRPGASTSELDAMREAEFKLAQQDRLANETSEAMNELESYVLGSRNNCYEKWADFVEEGAKGAFMKQLDDMENWLYDEGFDATKGVYLEKLNALTAVGGPIAKRYSEAQGRSEAAGNVRTAAEKWSAAAATGDETEKYAHITAEEKAKVAAACADALKWLDEMLSKQESTPKTADVVVTIAELSRKASDLTSTCRPIMERAKPVPKKEEPKKEEAKEGEKKDGDAKEVETQADRDAKAEAEAEGAAVAEGGAAEAAAPNAMEVE